VKSRLYSVALGLLLTGAGATPAQADTVTVTGLDTLAWDTPEVNIRPGDSVRWTFPGTTQFHNVWAASPNWTDKSDVGSPAPDYTRAFTELGDYAFICQVHPDTMRGTVHVTAEAVPTPTPTPIPLSQQYFANDTPGDAPVETAVALDTTKPTLSALSAKRAVRGAKVRFKVSEDTVTGVVFSRGKKIVKTYAVTGTGTLSFTARGLKAGKYAVTLVAVDVAGNESKARTLRVTVR
jgi:plastocyanin